LQNAVVLKVGASLRIYMQGKPAVITKTATGTVVDTMKEFSGTSSVDCLLEKTQVSLVRDPRGLLNTLMVVVGKGGTRHDEENEK
jgi:hypothetical protein